MRGFNLPITIESRKIIYLDLQENSNFNEDDIFIVSAPENSQKRTIIAISKEKLSCVVAIPSSQTSSYYSFKVPGFRTGFSSFHIHATILDLPTPTLDQAFINEL